jgi:glutathione synthase/RimK-type ligase-like ATP-grasp enzyme
MKAMIAYHKRSCVTGKLLRSLLNIPRKRTQKRTSLDVFIRWGNAESFPVNARLELNTRDAVTNASNKLRMLQLLKANNIPSVDFTTDPSQIVDFLDESGNCYIRDNLGVVRYGNDFSSLDQYASRPVANKKREYRVHVFNSQVVAIYEKIPLSEDQPKLFKSYNCSFKLRNPEICRLNKDGQQIAINAVNSLGLLFGGVDVIMTSSDEVLVCEVNSAPGLNSTNATRWIEKIKEYINENISSNA